jgi:hypothetical protein
METEKVEETTMPGAALNPGDGAELLASASRAAATYNSDDFWMLRGGGAIVTVIVTSVGAAGSIDTISIQAKNGDNYDTVISFAAQAIIATGRYRYRIAPGAALADLWKGAAQDVMPVTGRVQVIHTVNAMVYSVTVEAVGS